MNIQRIIKINGHLLPIIPYRTSDVEKKVFGSYSPDEKNMRKNVQINNSLREEKTSSHNHILPDRVELAPGLVISRLINGLWQMAGGHGDIDSAKAVASMQAYINSGLTTFDMADHYGPAEVIVGTYLSSQHASARNKLQCFTKWVPDINKKITRSFVRESIQTSLTRLHVKRIDLLQFHWWDFKFPGWLDAMKYLFELKKEGFILAIGVTNFDTAHLRILVSSGYRIVSNQVHFSLLDMRAAKDMSSFCIQHKIKLLAYGTLAGGLLTKKFLGQSPPSTSQIEAWDWSKMKYYRFLKLQGPDHWNKLQKLLHVLHNISEKYIQKTGRIITIANIASRFILQQQAVGGIIIGARLGLSQHIGVNKQLFSFSISLDDSNAIMQVLEKNFLIKAPGDCGDEYRRPPFLTASGDLSHHLTPQEEPFQLQVGKRRYHYDSGTVWEKLAGFSRAIRLDNWICVSGTTSTHGLDHVGGRDVAAQTHFIFDKIELALWHLGADLSDVIRTRIFVKDKTQWEAVCRVHASRFSIYNVKPANTLIQVDLVGNDELVEIEADAIVPRN